MSQKDNNIKQDGTKLNSFFFFYKPNAKARKHFSTHLQINIQYIYRLHNLVIIVNYGFTKNMIVMYFYRVYISLMKMLEEAFTKKGLCRRLEISPVFTTAEIVASGEHHLK